MTLLFIDDDPDDLELFREAVRLVDASHTCLTATRGDNGMAVLGTVKPDLIFLDINMPGLGGWELVRLIRAKSDFNDVPVYMLSTTHNVSEREMFIRVGATQCLVKPSSFHELCEIFRNVLTEKQKS